MLPFLRVFFLLLLINSLGETNRARKRQKRQLLVWYIQTDRHWRSHEQQEEAKILTHVTKKNERKCLSTSTISLSLLRLPSKITQKKRTCNNNNNIQLWCATAGQALFIFPLNILLRLVLNSILWNYFSNPRKKNNSWNGIGLETPRFESPPTMYKQKCPAGVIDNHEC